MKAHRVGEKMPEDGQSCILKDLDGNPFIATFCYGKDENGEYRQWGDAVFGDSWDAEEDDLWIPCPVFEE